MTIRYAELSWNRFVAIMLKEVIQFCRDKVSLSIMLVLPLIQLLLFSYAINNDPKFLPTAINIQEAGPLSRAFIAALDNSRYFRVDRRVYSEAEAETLLATGEVQFVITFPAGFERAFVRGETPALLIEADTTDPLASTNALLALQHLVRTAWSPALTGPLQRLDSRDAPVDLRLHRRYNPEGSTQYNTVPGLMGVILTMTMVMVTALSVTRERERGTMESLLSMPTHPVEVMLGKVLPYIAIGYIQALLILAVSIYIFEIPLCGSVLALIFSQILFILSNLTVGFTFSILAKNQLQAMEMSFFYFLPSIILSGFAFPFRGMPAWAQMVGEIFPLTHFLRVVRGIMLKGNGFSESWPELWPIGVFVLVSAAIALKSYKLTLD